MNEKIQMADLKSQYLRIKEEIDQPLLTAVSEDAYINGAQVKAFIEAFIDSTKYVNSIIGNWNQ